MLTALTLVVLAVVLLVLVLLGVIVVGIRQEPRSAELSEVAPSPIAVVVRRLTGLYVLRPTPIAVSTDQQEEGSRDTPAARAKTTTEPQGERR
jgi:hypothetical protein